MVKSHGIFFFKNNFAHVTQFFLPRLHQDWVIVFLNVFYIVLGLWLQPSEGTRDQSTQRGHVIRGDT